MSRAPLISVVMAARDASKWVGDAVRSVLAQDMRALELIMVDDGSRDDTIILAHEAAAGDKRLIILEQPQKGLSAARNAGIGRARGKWIAFADADDIVDSRMLSTLLGVARTRRTQAVSSPLQPFLRKPSRSLRNPGDSRLYDSRVAVAMALLRRGLDSSVCGKLYSRELFEGLRFTEGKHYEDLDIFYRLWLRSDGVAHVHFPLYFYRQHPESFLHRWSPARTDVLDVTMRMERFMREQCPELLSVARVRSFRAACNVMRAMRLHGIQEPDVRNRCLEIIAGRRSDVLFGHGPRLRDKMAALAAYLLKNDNRQQNPTDR